MLVSWILSFIPAFRRKDTYSVSISFLIPLISIVCSLSGRLYSHYAILLIPLCVMSISHAVGYLKFPTKNMRINISLVVSLLVFAYCGVFSISKYIVEYYAPRSSDADLVQALNYIEEFSTENDEITVYGNRDSIYLLSNRRSASVYSYQYPVDSIDENIRKQYFLEIEESQPKLVIITHRKGWDIQYDEIIEFVNNNNYRELSTTNGSIDVYVHE